MPVTTVQWLLSGFFWGGGDTSLYIDSPIVDKNMARFLSSSVIPFASKKKKAAATPLCHHQTLEGCQTLDYPSSSSDVALTGHGFTFLECLFITRTHLYLLSA